MYARIREMEEEQERKARRRKYVEEESIQSAEYAALT
jgi:hypothetical protein